MSIILFIVSLICDMDTLIFAQDIFVSDIILMLIMTMTYC